MLTLLIALPLLGALVLLGIPGRKLETIRAVATITTAATLLLGLKLLLAFQPGAGGYQFVERMMWIPAANITYFLGLDGISLPMVLLTVLLGFLACLASFGITERAKEYFIFYLLLLAGLLGTFLSLDLFLFYVFWEIVLVPMYFLIAIWGGGRREYSAMKFFLYTLAGSLAMLLGIVVVYLHTGTFDLLVLRAHGGQDFPLALQQVLFLAFFLAFAIKVPVVPFHTWLPDAHVDAPTPISVLLAGILLKMGGYGFFRISYPLCPDGAQWFSVGMAALGMINIVYGAFVALAQTDFKRLVAYSSVSHMGFVTLGLASGTQAGLNGAMYMMLAHGTISAMLFMLVGVIYDRAHHRDIDRFGGLGVNMPVYAGLLIVFSLASLGLPGLCGFVGEFMSLIGAYGPWRWQTAVSVLGIVAAAAYMLKVMQQVLLGPLKDQWKSLRDISPRELLSVVPLLLLVIALGVYPLALLRLQESGIQQLMTHVTGK